LLAPDVLANLLDPFRQRRPKLALYVAQQIFARTAARSS